jgi:hypothetical protein
VYQKRKSQKLNMQVNANHMKYVLKENVHSFLLQR